MFVADESGFGLQGSLDGQNRRFKASRVMRTDLPVEVFLNGDRLLAGLDDGFVVVDNQTIDMKIAPVEADTLVVKFSADPAPVGLPDGVPQIINPIVLGSATITAQIIP